VEIAKRISRDPERLVGRDKNPIAMSGFGVEGHEALDRSWCDRAMPREQSMGRGGREPISSSLFSTRRWSGPAAELAAERGLAFASVQEGQTVRGKLLGSTQLASGRFYHDRQRAWFQPFSAASR
jgi:hypothetical protein